jgi:hypothetical protein
VSVSLRRRRTASSALGPDGFYGWRIVGLTALLTAMTAPGQTVGVSVFVDPMIQALELSRSQMSLAYLVGTLAGAIGLPAMLVRWIMESSKRPGSSQLAAPRIALLNNVVYL